MSIRSWLLLIAIVVNLFSLEYSRPFYSMFFFVSVIKLILEFWGILGENNKDAKKKQSFGSTMTFS